MKMFISRHDQEVNPASVITERIWKWIKSTGAENVESSRVVRRKNLLTNDIELSIVFHSSYWTGRA